MDNDATSPKSEVSSDVKQTTEDEPSADSKPVKKPENAEQKTQVEITGVPSTDQSGKSDDGKEIMTSKPKKTIRKRGRKPGSVKKSGKPVDSTHVDGEKEAEQSLDNGEDTKIDLPSSAREDQSAEAGLPLDGKETDVAQSSPKEQNESKDVSSPSKSAQAKNVEESPKESDGSSDTEGKACPEVGKRTEDESCYEDKTPVAVKTSKDIEATDDAETNTEKQSSQKAQASTVDKHGASKRSGKLEKGPMKRKMGRPKDKADSSSNDAEKVKIFLIRVSASLI